MRCRLCGRTFKQDDAVIPVLTYVENEKRADFVTTAPQGYLHVTHLDGLL